jgi:hypothetical protein
MVMGMRVALILILFLFVLTGCASPSHDYFGTPAQAVQVDGRDYRVFLRRDGGVTRAQVIRMGWAGGRDHRPIIAAMTTAAERASGCTAVPGSVMGDSGVQNLRLTCAG